MNPKNTKMLLESKNICFVSFAFECRVKFLKYPRSIKKTLIVNYNNEVMILPLNQIIFGLVYRNKRVFLFF
jgi:hypothetical protein